MPTTPTSTPMEGAEELRLAAARLNESITQLELKSSSTREPQYREALIVEGDKFQQAIVEMKLIAEGKPPLNTLPAEEADALKSKVKTFDRWARMVEIHNACSATGITSESIRASAEKFYKG